MNGKFVEKYGEAWKEMDHDMKLMVIMSEIFDLRERIEPVSKYCKMVDNHSTYWKIMTPIGLIIIASLIGIIVNAVVN